MISVLTLEFAIDWSSLKEGFHMGVIMEPFSILLKGIEHRFKSYKRTLKSQDQKHLEKLFAWANENVSACQVRASANPFESFIVSAAIGLAKENELLKQCVEKLESRLNRLEKQQ